MMDFNQFKNYVRDNIADYMLLTDIRSINIQTIKKNNGTEYTSLQILEKGSNAAPNIYLERYYDDYINGADTEGLLNRIAGEYRRAKKEYSESIEQEADRFINSYNPDRLYIRAVNYEQNKERLANCVYEKYNDLALEVRYLINANADNMASAMIDYKNLAAWETGYKSIIEQAKANTPELFPVKYGSMFSIIEEMTGVKIPDAEAEPPMVVITNTRGVNGAAMIAYPEIIGDILSEYGIGDAYILPSSIHELIAVPKELGDNSLFQLTDMVHDINRTTVSRDDFLSDNVYKYDSRTKTISLADEEKSKDNNRIRDYGDREI